MMNRVVSFLVLHVVLTGIVRADFAVTLRPETNNISIHGDGEEVVGLNLLSASGYLAPGAPDVSGPFEFVVTNTETEITYGNLGTSVTLSGTIELPAGWSPLHRAQFSPQHLAAQAGLAEDGGGFDPPLVDVTVVPFFNNAPRVTSVFVNGTRWSDDFRAKLADLGVGDARFGYAIPGATPSALDRTQLDTLPWLELDELSIRFNKSVNVQSADLQLASSTPIEIAGFSYDPSTATATWSLQDAIGSNNVLAVLDGGAGGVTDADGLQRLDGEWTNGSSDFSSGDGIEGGSFSFRLHSQPGDVNGDAAGRTDITDVIAVRNHQFTSVTDTPPTNYSVFHDANGFGTSPGSTAQINILDVIGTRNNQFTSLPEPAAALGISQPVPEPTTGLPVCLGFFFGVMHCCNERRKRTRRENR